MVVGRRDSEIGSSRSGCCGVAARSVAAGLVYTPLDEVEEGSVSDCAAGPQRERQGDSVAEEDDDDNDDAGGETLASSVCETDVFDEVDTTGAAGSEDAVLPNSD